MLGVVSFEFVLTVQKCGHRLVRVLFFFLFVLVECMAMVVILLPNVVSSFGDIVCLHAVYLSPSSDGAKDYQYRRR